METGKKPIVFLAKNLNANIRVKLKNDLEYRGRLVKCDNYMNLILDNATEYASDEPVVQYGSIFIRGNNIIMISFQ
ncbi:LSM domain-containing protein [Candidatus Hecatella orcuttiae]|uniref:LSM domain-containing protein n=1 Tax=Candidatus Hecatella orcuttiae TaxID=1935119 RepID=UPI002867EAB0|nr:LSM domain-containing protein [Candidatus Hecatella orcuttiae]